MSEITLTEIEHRLIQAEENIKELFGKYNGIDKSLVATTTTLNRLSYSRKLPAAVATGFDFISSSNLKISR